MKPLKLDEIWRLLPEVAELRPLLDLLAATSVPDPDRVWSSAGVVDTAGDRLVRTEGLTREAAAAAEVEAARLHELFAGISRALAALAAGDRTEAARAFVALAEGEESRDRPIQAEHYARAAWELSRDERDRRVASLALRRWARAARTRGDLATALSRYREAFEIARAMTDHTGAAEAAIGAGNVLEDQGLWVDAERYYREALAQLEEKGGEETAEKWHALLNLHIVLRSRGLHDESIPPLDSAAAVAERLGDPSAGVFLGNVRGQLSMAGRRFGEAEAHFRAALEGECSTGARVTVTLNLAEALLARDRLLEAADTAREAERMALAAGQTTALPEVYRMLGRIASASGHADAFVLFERALELIQAHGLPDIERARTLQAYAEAEASRGDRDAAHDLRRRAEELYAALGIAAVRHPWSEVFQADVQHPAAPPISDIDPSDDESSHA
jgi:tetratricopeptide (TPR) repeat protein